MVPSPNALGQRGHFISGVILCDTTMLRCRFQQGAVYCAATLPFATALQPAKRVHRLARKARHTLQRALQHGSRNPGIAHGQLRALRECLMAANTPEGSGSGCGSRR